MPLPCSICTHELRDGIDKAIIGGAPNRAVARQYGLSKDAVARHKPHITPALAVVRAERESQGARSLIDWLEDMVSRADRLLTTAEQAGNTHQALAAMRELRGCLETLGKVTGELRGGEGPHVTVNVLQSPEVQQLIVLLRTEFADQPERLAHVAARLALVDGSTA